MNLVSPNNMILLCVLRLGSVALMRARLEVLQTYPSQKSSVDSKSTDDSDPYASTSTESYSPLFVEDPLLTFFALPYSRKGHLPQEISFSDLRKTNLPLEISFPNLMETNLP